MPRLERPPILLYLIAAIVAFMILVAALWTTHALTSMTPKRSGLYGIFLNNGQVYFGNISKEDDQRLILTGIYYIQSDQQVSSTSSGVSLMKLGNEVHGPEDYMEITRSQVSFIEQLKPDGKVAKAIEAYKQK